MCGIIGIVSSEPVADRLVDGLRRMEYRGYDSAGVCTLDNGKLIRRRAEGKLNNLVAELAANPAPGDMGIAHTRWATHGAPTAQNAHPHATDRVALVHNGIIENFKELRPNCRQTAGRWKATPTARLWSISSRAKSRTAARARPWRRSCCACAAPSRWRSPFATIPAC